MTTVLVAQQQRPQAHADPWGDWTVEQISSATACPVAAVRQNWPLIFRELELRLIESPYVCAAAIATVAIETASTFEPIHEYGTPADWARYSGGARYAGRGFVQLTHNYNYRVYGEVLGVDLVGNPDLALEPTIAAAILAQYFLARGVAEAARDRNWREVRRRVQGGTAGLDRLVTIVTTLGVA